MSLKIRIATPEDTASIAEIYFSAFSSDPISQCVFPRNTSSQNFWLSMLDEEITDPSSTYLCTYDSSHSSNPIVSFAKWNSPSAPSQDVNTLPTWPEGSDSTLANHFFGTLAEKHNEIMKGKRHWYLETLATRKEYQGKGAAGQMLRWGLERADKDGVEVYLEASPEGKPIYERFGFVESGRFVVDLRGKGVSEEEEYVEVFMVRDIQAK